MVCKCGMCGTELSPMSVHKDGVTHHGWYCSACTMKDAYAALPKPSRIDRLLAEAVADVRANREREAARYRMFAATGMVVRMRATASQPVTFECWGESGE